MRTIGELIAECAVFEGLEPGHLELIAGCATNRVHRAGEHLMREGEPADSFFVIRRGKVALETFVPPSGELLIETLEGGEVLGWSWLVPPYRTVFDARAVETTHTVAFDGVCLRGKLEDDTDLGYRLMVRFARVMVSRLQATRLRLLDVYGKSSG